MAMYRVQPTENKMQLFLSTKFGDHYQEHDLENWLEQNPAILTDGQPLLIISRQPATEIGRVWTLATAPMNGRLCKGYPSCKVQETILLAPTQMASRSMGNCLGLPQRVNI